jgi:hypothetical protein
MDGLAAGQSIQTAAHLTLLQEPYALCGTGYRLREGRNPAGGEKLATNDGFSAIRAARPAGRSAVRRVAAVPD